VHKINRAGKRPEAFARAKEVARSVLEPEILNMRSGITPFVKRSEVEPLEVVEARAIARAFVATGGRLCIAARLVGLSRSTMLQKVREYGMEKLLRALRGWKEK